MRDTDFGDWWSTGNDSKDGALGEASAPWSPAAESCPISRGTQIGVTSTGGRWQRGPRAGAGEPSGLGALMRLEQLPSRLRPGVLSP